MLKPLVGRRGGRLSERETKGRATGHVRGFSLPELIAVIALIGIAIAIGIPIVNEQVRMAEVRAVADDLALHLRAARTIAVTKHTTVTFTVDVDPINRFRYIGSDGVEKEIKMPGRVRIAPASSRSINFKRNGSVDVASVIIVESDVSGARERWTASVSAAGLTKLVHERVN
jgi:prepilin-type N-terminal cleavage/methylation domain-containing protein